MKSVHITSFHHFPPPLLFYFIYRLDYLPSFFLRSASHSEGIYLKLFIVAFVLSATDVSPFLFFYDLLFNCVILRLLYLVCGPRKLSRYCVSVRGGRSGDRFQVRARVSAHVQKSRGPSRPPVEWV